MIVRIVETENKVVVVEPPMSVLIKEEATNVTVQGTGVIVKLTEINNKVSVQENLIKVIVGEAQSDIIQIGIPGPTGPAGAGAEPGEAESDVIIKAGQPVYLKNTGHVGLAKADAPSTSTVAGLASTNSNPGNTCSYFNDSNLTLTDWTEVIGTTTLTVGSIYYLSPTVAGKLTAVAPTIPGQCVAKIGQAINTISLSIEIEPRILL